MKPTVIKFIMVQQGKYLLLIRLEAKFLQLAQVEHQNGEVIFNNPQQT